MDARDVAGVDLSAGGGRGEIAMIGGSQDAQNEAASVGHATRGILSVADDAVIVDATSPVRAELWPVCAAR